MAWNIRLAPRSLKRQTLRPLSRPPKRIVIRKGNSIDGNIKLSLEDFKELVFHLRKRTFKQTNDASAKPIDSNTIDPERQYTCALCGESLVNKSTKKLLTSCNECKTKYVRQKIFHSQYAYRLKNEKQLNNPSGFFNHTITVFLKQSSDKSTEQNETKIADTQKTAKILVPPPNLYPGEIARRVCQIVEEVLHAMISGKSVFLDRERQTIFTENMLNKRVNSYRGDKVKLKERILKNSTKFESPQKSMGYLRLMQSRFIDKCKFGKDNLIRRRNFGRVLFGCARKTIGTSGSLPAGNVVLPSNVIRALGDSSRSSTTSLSCFAFPETMTLAKLNSCIKSEGNSTRYPVITKGNIFYSVFHAGGQRYTADVPSSQFKYNGGDNDGDAFNFFRFTNGLLANSAYECRLVTAPWFNLGNNGEIKIEFDSDAKFGLNWCSKTKQPAWVREIDEIRTQYICLSASFDGYKKFLEEEIRGREESRISGTFSLQNYANLLPSGALKQVIKTASIPRFTLAHFFHSTRSLGCQRYPYNKSPVLAEISGCLLSGLLPNEFCASCQSSVDALADQKSSEMSVHGQKAYQLQYCLRSYVLAYDRKTVYNAVTKKIVATNVSNLFPVANANFCADEIFSTAVDCARVAVGYLPLYMRSETAFKRLLHEASQFRNFEK